MMGALVNRVRGWISNYYEAGRIASPDRSFLQGQVQDDRHDASSMDRHELVRKSRYWDCNSGLANQLADIFCQYTVGNGLQLSPASDDADWNTRRLQLWNEWQPVASLTDRFHFGTLQQLMARRWFFDGEVFVLLTEGKDRGGIKRPRIKLIESHRVGTPDRAQRNSRIVNGIELDVNDRPIAYHIRDAAGNFRRHGAQHIIHLYSPTRVDQFRGIPFLAPVLNHLHDLEDLALLGKQKARDNAQVSYAHQTEGGHVPNPQKIFGRGPVSSLDAEGNSKSENILQKFARKTGAAVLGLKPGEELKKLSNDSPSVADLALWEHLTHQICAGVGIPKLMVFSDTKVQGTIARGAYDMAAGFFKGRSMIIQSAVRRIYEWTTEAERHFDTRLADLPGNYRAVNIQAPRAVNVDIGRNSAAMLKELEAGATTLERIYSPLGESWQANVIQRANEKRFIRELEVKEGVVISDASLVGVAAVAAAGPDLKSQIDAFGIAVRAGAVTPTPDDEAHFRKLAGLPDLRSEGVEAWQEEGNIRRPITLTQPGGDAAGMIVPNEEEPAEANQS